MIEYKIDSNKQYDGAIKKLLRGHNALYSNNEEFSEYYLYATKDKTLVGSLYVSYFWDWASLGDVTYESIDGLKALIGKAWTLYKDSAVGIKAFTTVKSRADDLTASGFTLSQAVVIDERDTYYYLEFKRDDILNSDFSIEVSKEANEVYQKEVSKHIKQFKEDHNLYDVTASFDMVALKEDTCVGGIQAEAYHDMLYISRLAVDTTLRKQGIGKILTLQAVEYAKEQKLRYVMLGTTDFQAREFYEKCGFKVVFVRADNPRGFNSYTMLYILEKTGKK